MKKHMRKPGTFKTGSFQEFKEFTLAVVRGKRKVDPRELGRIGRSFRAKGHSGSISIARSRCQASVAAEPRAIAPDCGPPAEIGK